MTARTELLRSTSDVLLVGGAAEIAALLEERRIKRWAAHVAEQATPVSLLVIDLRDAARAEILDARRAVDACVPVLALCADRAAEPIEALGATDALELPSDARHARRRVATLLELGQGRVEARSAAHDLLDALEVGVVIADDAGLVTFVNASAQALLRAGPLRHVPVREALSLPQNPEELLGGEPKRTFKHALDLPPGESIELDLCLSKHAEAPDRASYLFSFGDARGALKIEAEQLRTGHQAALGTLVAGFAHEVRNPMAALRSIAEELDEELTGAGLRLPHVGRMLRVLERIERLVRTSLSLGHPTTPRGASHRPWTLVSSALSQVLHRMRGKQDLVRIDMDASLPDVFCDAEQIAQVLSILLDNALDAAPPDRVWIRAELRRTVVDVRRPASVPPGAERVALVVEDGGPGIPPELHERIFDPFFTTKASGTGLGLSIATQIVAENRCRLDVSSCVGGPTRFTVLFPPHP